MPIERRTRRYRSKENDRAEQSGASEMQPLVGTPGLRSEQVMTWDMVHRRPRIAGASAMPF